VVAACGTGKTRIASAAVSRLAPRGRNLVVVPTLELAAQTLREWRDCGDSPLGTVVVACSDPAVLSGRDIDLGRDVTVTTLPEEIAAACAVPGRVTALSTYDSLPVVAAAHAGHDLPKWDCMVADEAHRTAGAAGGAWTTVHHDSLVPAVRRLYMTATPRVSGNADDDTVAMDDEAVYGPVCYRLPFGTAIGLGLLADYRVVVPVITDAEMRALAREASGHLQVGEAALSPGMLAAQIAVLRTAGEFGIRRAISYHLRIEDARLWAAALPHTAGLVPGGPARVWAAHLEGAHTGRERRRVLARLGAAGDEVCLVANAKVLAEGVDVPAVDAVVFTAPRDSAVDTVQAVGRALRTGGNPGKVATIVVPLLLAPGEDPERVVAQSAWARVWKVINALRDHDDRLDFSLTRLRRDMGARPGARQVLPDWLQVRGVPVPDGFAHAITVRAVISAVPKWEESYGAAEAFHARHGHLDVPSSYLLASGFDLGAFIMWMRAARRRGELSPARENLLNDIGMIWNTHDARWERGYALAAAFYKEHGHLLIPDSHVAVDGDGRGREYNLGKWLKAQREWGNNGRLHPGRRKRLDAIGMIWSVQQHMWERGFSYAQEHVRTHGDLDIVRSYVTPDDYPLGEWLYRQYMQHTEGQLPDDRAARLRQLDPRWADY
jgi:superfamily II DNA or RNA helicase